MTATAWDGPRRHPVAELATRLHAELDAAAEVSVWSMTDQEAAATLGSLTRLAARVAELELRVAASAEQRDLGAGTGATCTATWWAHATRLTRAEAHRRIRLATALDGAHPRVRVGLAAGDLLPDQAHVITEAIDALPTDLVDADLVDAAEAHLVALAAEHDAKALRILGRRVLDVVAPQVGEAHEERLLAAEEAAALAAARFTLTDDGHGSSHGRFTVPTAQGQMLRKQLDAITSPRHATTDQQRSTPERLGQGFVEWIERYPTDRLPQAGGLNATVVVTMTLETLTGSPRPAHLDTGAVISAGQARRIACEAAIIPAVLGGKSHVLDLSRSRRFHSAPQRIALALRDTGCTAVGCDRPPGGCHAHHEQPWSRGGPTNLAQGRLLCPRHHTLAHDYHYITTRQPNGKVAFTRRT